MTLVVVIFVAAVAVGASALWWIHKDGLAAEVAAVAPAPAVEIPLPRAAAVTAPAVAAAVPGQRSNNEVRAWGRAHGHAVSDRGPLPKALVTAFAAAHADA